MKKTIVKLACSAVILTQLACLSACGSKEPVGGDGTTLKYWVPLPEILTTHVKSYSEISMYQQREKESGVHIEFIHPATGQGYEQFTLLIASGDMPDIVEYNWSTYNGGPQKALEDGVIIPLDDVWDSVPNFRRALETGDLSEAYRRNSTTDSGKHYAFTGLNLGDYRVFGGPLIRRDWLDELGLDMPETIDDWTKALRAFKEKGAATPMTGVGFPENFSGAFGVRKAWYVNNDSVEYGPMHSEYKDYLTVLNQWYSEGLMDRDMASNKSTLVDARITDGSTGALANGNIGAGIGRYMKQKEAEGASYDLVGAPYPVLKKGEVNRFPAGEGDVNLTLCAAITSACKQPEVAAAWFDYWYSDEGYKLMNFGIEGEDYNMVDGKPVYTDKILKNPQGLSIQEALLLSCKATNPCAGIKQAPEYLEQYYEYPQQIETLELWTENTEYLRQTLLPKSLSPTEEENDITASIQADLETYVDEMLWNFVTGKESLDNYDSFVENLRTKFRIEEYRSVLQQQYDRYKAR